MAKEDFCFTYYDGDAAKDMSHMNRLERGCYIDIIHAIRKRGHLSTDDIKKVLGKDFDECWSSVEWALKEDESGKFYVEWLEKSIEQMRAHAKKQSENGSNGGRPPKPTKSQQKANKKPNINQKKPLEDGNGNEDGNKIKTELEDVVEILSPAQEVIQHLNDVAGTGFKVSTKNHLGFINARLQEGFTVGELKEIIELKTLKWKNTKYEEYLRPSTLFNSEKCEGYREEVRIAKQNPEKFKQSLNGQSGNYKAGATAYTDGNTPFGKV